MLFFFPSQHKSGEAAFPPRPLSQKTASTVSNSASVNPGVASTSRQTDFDEEMDQLDPVEVRKKLSEKMKASKSAPREEEDLLDMSGDLIDPNLTPSEDEMPEPNEGIFVVRIRSG